MAGITFASPTEAGDNCEGHMRMFGDIRPSTPVEVKEGFVAFRFSTDELAPNDRIAAWRETLGRIHIVPQIEPSDEHLFRGTIEQHSYSCVTLSFIETSPGSLSWPAARSAKGNCDRTLLLVDGALFDVISEEAAESLDCGDAVLLSGAAPVTIRLHSACRITVIRFPANSLPTASRITGSRAFALLAPSTPAFCFLVRNIKLLRTEAPTGDPVLIHRATNYLSELVSLALEPSAPHCPEVRRKSRLSPIIDDVLANLSKPGLSAKMIAKRHGISDRYVHLLFKQSGQTFSRFVLEERLKRAHALLSNPDLNWMRISELAFECGFSDLSTFNRSFRDRFGNHPRGVRAAFAARSTASKADRRTDADARRTDIWTVAGTVTGVSASGDFKPAA